jgi:hypothetical protein
MFSFLPVVALAAGAWAIPTFSARGESFAATALFESIEAAPSGWVQEDAALNKDEKAIELSIQLVHQDMDKFHDLAMNVCKVSVSRKWELAIGGPWAPIFVVWQVA